MAVNVVFVFIIFADAAINEDRCPVLQPHERRVAISHREVRNRCLTHHTPLDDPLLGDSLLIKGFTVCVGREVRTAKTPLRGPIGSPASYRRGSLMRSSRRRSPAACLLGCHLACGEFPHRDPDSETPTRL